MTIGLIAILLGVVVLGCVVAAIGVVVWLAVSGRLRP